MDRKKKALLAILLIAAFALAGCSQAKAPEAAKTEAPAATPAGNESGGKLVIAIGGMITPKAGLAYYEDLCKYIGKKVGREVELISKANYTEINDMIENRKVDVGFVCSGPYTKGKAKFGMTLLAAPQAYGVTTYNSYTIVPVDSAAKSMEDLKGKTFAFADPESNTGKMVPTYTLAKMNTTPEEFFGKTFYTYSHDNSIKAVANKQADGAAVDSLIWEYANATNPEFTSKTKVIAKSAPYGIPPVVIHPDMDPALKTKLEEIFMNLDKDPEAKAMLDKMKIEKFVKVEDSAYDTIREMDKWIEEQKAKKK